MRGKMHMAAPLPFVGQKRMFAKEYIKILPQFNDKTVFVDLFGGSGLLSHITKHLRPEATVVYNDYDNYRERLAHIPQTNALLADLRAIVGNTPKHKRIDGEMREKMFERLRHEEQTVGYIDFITISASVMFSMKYELSIEEMEKQTLYNNIRKNDYPTSEDYLEGLTIESCTIVNYTKSIKMSRMWCLLLTLLICPQRLEHTKCTGICLTISMC